MSKKVVRYFRSKLVTAGAIAINQEANTRLGGSKSVYWKTEDGELDSAYVMLSARQAIEFNTFIPSVHVSQAESVLKELPEENETVSLLW